ncbi:MAG: ketol-acid reductoisomerase [Thaumarchaeota archaeon]|jgi:ketol-acid reductoisomerase|nr:ketol-acid reductoisomerase [Nitrososphaerota archaeon]
MARIIRDDEISIELIKNKTVAVIGYGSQGEAQAKNIRDSGVNTIIGLRREGSSWRRASEDGFEVYEISEAVRKSSIILMLIPDPAQPAVYRDHVEPNISKGSTLVFAHAFNIHYRQIVPSPWLDVVLVAPKAPGPALREAYVRGTGVPGLIAVHQDYTGNASRIVRELGKAVGLSRIGLIETSFKEEVETDLFGEQAVLCGGVSSLIKSGFEILVEAGYQPEVAYFEVLNELKLIVDLIWSKGLSGMWQAVSDTAKYGGLTRGPYLIDEDVKRKMRKLLEDVQTGVFAREWILENSSNQVVLKTLVERERNHLIETVGRKIRSMVYG